MSHDVFVAGDADCWGSLVFLLSFLIMLLCTLCIAFVIPFATLGVVASHHHEISDKISAVVGVLIISVAWLGTVLSRVFDATQCCGLSAGVKIHKRHFCFAFWEYFFLVAAGVGTILAWMDWSFFSQMGGWGKAYLISVTIGFGLLTALGLLWLIGLAIYYALRLCCSRR